MSDNVCSTGWMVPLKEKLSSERRDELNELLYEYNSIVRLNYEGTLAYTDNDVSMYGISFFTNKEDKDFHDVNIIKEALKEFNIEIDEENARKYTCVWYNGSDSDMDMMLLHQFLN